MDRFWVYLDNQVQGPVEVPALRKMPGFNLLTQVCVEGQESWRMADEVIEIKAYFSSPPRGSSLIPDAQSEIATLERPQAETPVSVIATGTLLRPMDRVLQPEVETLPGMPAVAAGNTVPAPAANPGGLRVPCATCGYKNPRDVTICMKCATPIKAAPAAAPGDLPEREKLGMPSPVKNPFSVKLEETVSVASVAGGGILTTDFRATNG